ncbi:MAG TPA: SigE family RNA polymerase sigma factor [Stackebrandtia sp.]|jgi:RNA polymerase sigma-70 factor (sigma-E family)|uniref:SigE family RNA polymerase sigma factor n=1 Tax=Stackebrandtia sp. TaxID=2023065 RepID=UPI002D270ABA|nr:SigE family RNA polymerase sigma factor [Stackebrandtia sp.]HZE41254.1 SigE family RNA polymerase sigma factor [Stackebrandtia sp.]
MAHEPPDREFDEFARARTPALLRSAFLLTGDQHLAEDLVQTALAKTLLAWKRLQRTENAEAYTRKVMYHLQVGWWRRRARERAVLQLVDRPDTQADASEDIARQIALHQALQRLTKRQRAVLVLRFFEDRGVNDTARILGCTVGTVKSQTAKALLRMRAELPDDFQTQEWSLA